MLHPIPKNLYVEDRQSDHSSCEVSVFCHAASLLLLKPPSVTNCATSFAFASANVGSTFISASHSGIRAGRLDARN